MRVLFTIMPGMGHLHPVVPLARALEGASHEVAFATASSFRSTVESAGFRLYPAGPDFQQMIASRLPPGAFRQALAAQMQGGTGRWPQLMGDVPQAAQEGIPANAPPSGPHMGAFLSLLIQTAIEETVPDLLALFEEWKPDVIVRSHFEAAGYLAAELAGIPHATAGIGLFGVTRMLQQFAGDKIQAFRSQHSLPPDPELHSFYRYLYLSFAPPSFQAGAENVSTLHFLRPMADDTIGGAQLPGWIDSLPDRPTVYITLGTMVSMFNESRTVFEKILAGMRDDPLNLIVTVGRNHDPAAFGPQPDNVHIERYIPMSLLLSHCDVVVAHGGFNTTMTTLSHGVPSLLIPVSADQPFNAQRCVELGVGLMIPPAELQPDAVRAAVHTLIEQPGYAERARHIQQEIAALPGPEHGVALLTRLAEEKRPLTYTER